MFKIYYIRFTLTVFHDECATTLVSCLLHMSVDAWRER